MKFTRHTLAIVALLLLSACTTPQPSTVTVTDAEARAEYEHIISRYGGQEYKVRHILVEHQAEAKAALDRIKAGEAFESVARQVSRDPESAVRGGDLGWNAKDNFVPEFSVAMVALAPHGLTAEPIRSPFGWHVIEVTSVRPMAFPPFEQVKAQIVERMRQHKQRLLQNKANTSAL